MHLKKFDLLKIIVAHFGLISIEMETRNSDVAILLDASFRTCTNEMQFMIKDRIITNNIKGMR